MSLRRPKVSLVFKSFIVKSLSLFVIENSSQPHMSSCVSVAKDFQINNMCQKGVVSLSRSKVSLVLKSLIVKSLSLFVLENSSTTCISQPHMFVKLTIASQQRKNRTAELSHMDTDWQVYIN